MSRHRIPDNSPAADEFRSRLDTRSRGKTNPQNTEDEAREIDVLRRENTGDNKEKGNTTRTWKFPSDRIVDYVSWDLYNDVPTE